jgi:hypothetical protein
MAKTKIVVMVGSGFSAALTAASPALATPGLVGNSALPTLCDLTAALRQHAEQEIHRRGSGDFPFQRDTLRQTLTELEAATWKLGAEQNFEEFISSKVSTPEVFECTVYFLYDLFARRLSLERQNRANRNFWYTVNRASETEVFRRGLFRLVDTYDVFFVSFNYDGLLEAPLDTPFGKQPPEFRYLPEVSHAFNVVMPEFYETPDTRHLNRFSVPIILKPHGSIHFFRAKDGGDSDRIVAVHPRLDLGFNPWTMQRDIGGQRFWDLADRVPVIVPPVLNKDTYLRGKYLSRAIELLREQVALADRVISLGFSVPPSDGHIAEALKSSMVTANVGLVFRAAPSDSTVKNWGEICPRDRLTILSSSGIPLSSEIEIETFWRSAFEFLDR